MFAHDTGVLSGAATSGLSRHWIVLESISRRSEWLSASGRHPARDPGEVGVAAAQHSGWAGCSGNAGGGDGTGAGCAGEAGAKVADAGSGAGSAGGGSGARAERSEARSGLVLDRACCFSMAARSDCLLAKGPRQQR